MPRGVRRSPARDEDPRPEDIEALDDVTRKCPACRAVLYDDAEVCWKCGHALSGESAAPPEWVRWTAGALVGALLLYFLVRSL